jgi:hypothetical protein
MISHQPFVGLIMGIIGIVGASFEIVRFLAFALRDHRQRIGADRGDHRVLPEPSVIIAQIGVISKC